MASGQNYSYLDLSVHPELSSWVLAPEATVLFNGDLRAILWANASGANLFGGRGVVELLDANLTDDQAFVRQLRDAVRQMQDGDSIIRGFRVTQGARAALLQFEIRAIRFPDDNICYRVIQKSASQTPAIPEYEMAQRVVDSLEGFADAAAILDDYGLPLAATSAFTNLGPSDETLASVVSELLNEEDRLIKRPLLSVSSDEVLAGLGRVSDNPGRNLIVLATRSEIEKTSLQEANEKAEPVATEVNDDVDGPVTAENTSVDEIQEEEPSAEESEQNVEDAATEQGLLEESEPDPNDEFDAFEALQDYENRNAAVDKTDSASETEKASETPSSTATSFSFAPREEPVRFAWTVDDEGVFTSVSDELAETIGPDAADVIGRSWKDVAQVFGFDTSGEINALLKKRDTWSGKTVLWPVQGTDLAVPIDLAALPAFGAERKFEGFRGFGIIRTLDAVIDPEETGLAFTSELEVQNPPDLETGNSSNAEDVDDATKRLLWFELDEPVEPEISTIEDELSQSAAEDDLPERPSNVVPLNRPSSKDKGDLSKTETEAFEKIGSKLRQQEQETQSPEPSQKTGRQPDTSLIENLPVAVLIYRNGQALFANDKLLSALGFAGIEEINASGGIDAIMPSPSEDESADNTSDTQLLRADKKPVKVKPVLHSVPWDSEKALQLSFPVPLVSELSEIDAIEISQAAEIQSILDTTSDGIILLTEEGSIISVNASAEALFNTSFEEITGKHFTSLFATSSHAEINQYVNALAEPSVASLMQEGKEVRARESTGGEFPVFLTIARLQSTKKLCAIVQDLTSWKKTEQELIRSRQDAERANEQKSDFLAQVSHEVRTPLNAIIGFSDIMIEERFGPIENLRYREYVRDIKKSGQHVLELINDLLDLSKIEAGKLELSFDAVELNRCVTETVAMLQPQANAKRVIIRTSLSRAVPKVVADQRTIRQIIINLVTNAIKYSKVNTQVIVTTVYESSGEVALRVRDSGEGMSEEEIAKALKPYQQIRTNAETPHEGTGLGLPLTKALVEANRAFFDIESEPGQGTVVHVQFPTQRVLAD